MPSGKGPSFITLSVLIVLGLVTFLESGLLKIGYTPSQYKTLNSTERRVIPSYDVLGRTVSKEEAQELLKTEEGKALLSPKGGAVAIDEALLRLGRKSFYEETFGNEVGLREVVGMLDGPLTAKAIAEAIAQLGGKGTTNLTVELSHDAVVGGRTFKKGELLATGLDVPKGALTPLGMTIKMRGTRVEAGITCAVCHSTVDPSSHLVIDGAPNADLNIGVLSALATNSAAFFVHTDVRPEQIVRKQDRQIVTSTGEKAFLPDPKALEDAVDAVLVQWPPGYFDSISDFVAAPRQIPSSFTWENYPYSHSGPFMVGPFHGLSTQNNNVHALNSDPFSEVDQSATRFGIDPELFYAVLLQNAANEKFRYYSSKREKPSEFFKTIDPTPGYPGMNKLIPLPLYPKASLIEPTSLLASDSGFAVWEKVNAMSAWQNSLIPPAPPFSPSSVKVQKGRQVFDRAKCTECHSGVSLTNHQILPVEKIKTQPLRARGLKNVGAELIDPVLYALDQKVPLVNPVTFPVPIDQLDPYQITLAYALGESQGGYKVPSLIGLYWTAPYLHDGGVSVGPQLTQLGIPQTLLVGVTPDAKNSLRALINRDLRWRVIEANHAHAQTAAMSIEGIGHEYWVDEEAGFSSDEEENLLDFLLTFRAS